MARFRLDPESPPVLSRTQATRLDSMSDATITAAAESDGDNPPLDRTELLRLQTARAFQRARKHTGLSQSAFARAFRINLARLRDLEQGRTQADSALLAYLTVIERDPALVRRALEEHTVPA